jgi:hypothetical protein
LRCLAHALHNVCKKGLREKSEAVQKIRELMIKLKRPRAKEDFRAALQKKDNGFHLDVPTRWNSTYLMCVSVLKLRPALDEYLSTHRDTNFNDFMLDDDEWKVIEELVAVLEPFNQATNDFSAIDRPTLHFAMSSLIMLREHLAEVMKLTHVNTANVFINLPFS